MSKDILQTTEETYKGRGFTQTQSGLHFRLEDPRFSIEDIAHGLSLNCRFNGQCRVFYSVAEHSMLVAGLMQQAGADPMEGLLHDGVEAYLSDVPAPFKQYLPDWQKLENELDRKLRAWAGISADKTEACKLADWIACFLEAYELVPDAGKCFTDPHGLRQKALELRARTGLRLARLEPEEAEEEFLEAYHSILEGAFEGSAGRG